MSSTDLPLKNKRQFVIADIHGCSKTLKKLLDKVALSKDDELYFLGDFIDKGKDSAGVLDIIISLNDKGYKILPLRGNHEENLLLDCKNYEPRMFKGYVTRFNKSGNLLDDKGRIIPKYIEFIQSLPYYYELDDFWIVHAGFNTKRNDFLEDTHAMLEITDFKYDLKKLKGKRVIHGHMVKDISEIRKSIENESMIIPLDNGCVYNSPNKRYDHNNTGYLNCLNLDTFELISVKNEE